MSFSDIKLMVHWGVPKSVIALWQEIGHGARGGGEGMSVVYKTGHTLGTCNEEVNKALCQEEHFVQLLVGFWTVKALRSAMRFTSTLH